MNGLTLNKEVFLLKISITHWSRFEHIPLGRVNPSMEPKTIKRWSTVINRLLFE